MGDNKLNPLDLIPNDSHILKGSLETNPSFAREFIDRTGIDYRRTEPKTVPTRQPCLSDLNVIIVGNTPLAKEILYERVLVHGGRATMLWTEAKPTGLFYEKGFVWAPPSSTKVRVNYVEPNYTVFKKTAMSNPSLEINPRDTVARLLGPTSLPSRMESGLILVGGENEATGGPANGVVASPNINNAGNGARKVVGGAGRRASAGNIAAMLGNLEELEKEGSHKAADDEEGSHNKSADEYQTKIDASGSIVVALEGSHSILNNEGPISEKEAQIRKEFKIMFSDLSIERPRRWCRPGPDIVRLDSNEKYFLGDMSFDPSQRKSPFDPDKLNRTPGFYTGIRIVDLNGKVVWQLSGSVVCCFLDDVEDALKNDNALGDNPNFGSPGNSGTNATKTESKQSWFSNTSKRSGAKSSLYDKNNAKSNMKALLSVQCTVCRPCNVPEFRRFVAWLPMLFTILLFYFGWGGEEKTGGSPVYKMMLPVLTMVPFGSSGGPDLWGLSLYGVEDSKNPRHKLINVMIVFICFTVILLIPVHAIFSFSNSDKEYYFTDFWMCALGTGGFLCVQLFLHGYRQKIWPRHWRWFFVVALSTIGGWLLSYAIIIGFLIFQSHHPNIASALFPVLTAVSEGAMVWTVGHAYRLLIYQNQGMILDDASNYTGEKNLNWFRPPPPVSDDQFAPLTFGIALAHAYFESAKLTGSIVGAILTGGYSWVLTSVLASILTLLGRFGWMRMFVVRVVMYWLKNKSGKPMSPKKRFFIESLIQPTVITKLHDEVKFLYGYPRFIAPAALILSQLIWPRPVLPNIYPPGFEPQMPVVEMLDDTHTFPLFSTPALVCFIVYFCQELIEDILVMRELLPYPTMGKDQLQKCKSMLPWLDPFNLLIFSDKLTPMGRGDSKGKGDSNNTNGGVVAAASNNNNGNPTAYSTVVRNNVSSAPQDQDKDPDESEGFLDSDYDSSNDKKSESNKDGTHNATEQGTVREGAHEATACGGTEQAAEKRGSFAGLSEMANAFESKTASDNTGMPDSGTPSPSTSYAGSPFSGVAAQLGKRSDPSADKHPRHDSLENVEIDPDDPTTHYRSATVSRSLMLHGLRPCSLLQHGVFLLPTCFFLPCLFHLFLGPGYVAGLCDTPVLPEDRIKGIFLWERPLRC